MELKGFVRQGRNVALVGAAVGAVVGLTAPMASAEETAATSWTMPYLKTEVLQDAVDTVTETAGSENVRFNVVNRGPIQVVYNYTNWIVCNQSPAGEKLVTVGAKPQTVTLVVVRPSAGC